MTKQEHIEYWKSIAQEDMEFAIFTMNAEKNVQALFFFHLCIEKMFKALWIHSNLSDTPPFTHDLKKLASETEIELTSDLLDELSIINDWNIEARYPDFKKRLHKTANKAYMQYHFTKVKSLYECIHAELSKK